MQKIPSAEMIILDGKELADKILSGLAKKIKSRQLKLQLAVILVGEDPSSRIFINQKRKACKAVGINFKLFQFYKNCSRNFIEGEIKKIANNPENSGIIIQLPLPKKFDAEELLNLIPEEKDVDVLSGKSFQKFAKGRLDVLPPTIGALAVLFKKYRIKLKKKNVVVVGRGRLVGKPLAAWLKLQEAKFSVVDKNTKNINWHAKKADILISGAGKRNLIGGNMVKKGAVVIDFDHDVDFKSVSKKAGYITPVPGGVGPVTVACLLENLIKLNK